jgi:hypothetical protein
MLLRCTVLLAYLAALSSAYSPSIGSQAARPALRRPASPVPLAHRVRMQTAPQEEEVEEYEEYEEEPPPPPSEPSEGAQRVINNMKSETGVEFAPWMKVDAEAIARAKKEREERKRRQAAQANSMDEELMRDPQAAELGAGGGLKSKVLSEEEVELRWSTQDEAGNAGFVVQRRQGGSSSFADLETFESFAPLRTKGPNGGDYVYLDDTAAPGTWVYRIVDCDTQGRRAAICQKLVEIDSQSEQTATLVLGGVIFSLAVAGFIFGIVTDPLQTTDAGGKLFG